MSVRVVGVLVAATGESLDSPGTLRFVRHATIAADPPPLTPNSVVPIPHFPATKWTEK
jgi:hypothetical protein